MKSIFLPGQTVDLRSQHVIHIRSASGLRVNVSYLSASELCWQIELTFLQHMRLCHLLVSPPKYIVAALIFCRLLTAKPYNSVLAVSSCLMITSTVRSSRLMRTLDLHRLVGTALKKRIITKQTKLCMANTVNLMEIFLPEIADLKFSFSENMHVHLLSPKHCVWLKK